jgi:hypothetical protein
MWWEDVSGDKCVSRERIVSMRPLTLTLWPWNWNSLPLCIWRFLVDIWCEDASRDKGLSPNFIFLATGTVHPYWISLNKKIAEVGLTHEPCPLCQNHVIIRCVYHVSGEMLMDIPVLLCFLSQLLGILFIQFSFKHSTGQGRPGFIDLFHYNRQCLPLAMWILNIMM